ncbi:SulP family inorganic anion transporter [Francisella adeliensis]|uniref:Sodium-independent anion transporter n=1 Tax=Francisella adeliensis TaxID=2007306 RepID=A0A2Z4XYJ9_9GAMM|nr:SulP family inorganic anion transporter [Francisella adeliensis]AXA33562.1 sodium-independent anion transporter [Francisella adeliensis]MBK2084732.1 SulP family inorganic anion transporter [Francisella adeliensis]MBK2097325.1 SulP family inorganic anion transporter [Francisella adeliensis]QIW11793.1 SulP family inorganic anion transporter [Francisella adeliensis]QIW13669.1 SulP family inorganic anion transporter [Francisella adeliensis]
MLDYKNNFIGRNVKSDVLSGFVVAVALIPEAIGFSVIAGVSPTVGLYTAFILGLITALIGGKPGMVSGATGAVAVVLVGLGIQVKASLSPEMLQSLTASGELSSYILQYILLCAIMAGVIQITIGLLRLGKLIRLVPQPAMYGFVNGLAIVIALAQIPLFHHEGPMMYGLVLLTMFIVYFLPKFTDKVPSGLVAIIAITAIVVIFKVDTKSVGDLADISGAFPSFAIPNIHITTESFITVLPFAVIVALVGLIESLLTLSVLDEMDEKHGNGNQECIAQGVGNITCGFFGGMAGCTMIGQSIINFTNGGRGRLSSLTAALLLISFVVALSGYISYIPVAVLAGIMFMVCINTFEWESVNRIRYMPNSDKFVLVAVTAITVYSDLAIAVISGVIISALVFAWKSSQVHSRTHREDENTKVYEFFGPLFFGSTGSFKSLLDINFDPENIVLDFANSRVMDISGAEAIDDITKKYLDLGKKVTVKHLSKDCRKVLKNAGPYCVFEEIDPTYKIARDM